MCGIVGYVGDKSAVGIIMDGLKRLEYRGYDSAGVAVLDDGVLRVRRAPGRLKGLEDVLREQPLDGTIGIGHTRWATHGRPSEENAHPHTDCHGSLVVVHNGILENYLELKERLAAEGHVFRSETDTEVLAHLVEHHLARRATRWRPPSGWRSRGRGSYALGVVAAAAPDGSSSPSRAPAASWSGSARARPSSPPTSRRSCPTRATWSSSRTARWRS